MKNKENTINKIRISSTKKNVQKMKKRYAIKCFITNCETEFLKAFEVKQTKKLLRGICYKFQIVQAQRKWRSHLILEKAIRRFLKLIGRKRWGGATAREHVDVTKKKKGAKTGGKKGKKAKKKSLRPSRDGPSCLISAI